MKIIQGLSETWGPFTQPKATIGTFDGVHVGHQRVLRELLTWARATESDAVVVTFHQKPRRVLDGHGGEQILSLEHRLTLFERAGIDACILLEFDQQLSHVEPEVFVKEYLVRKMGVSGVLLGHDTRFGHGGRGNFDMLRRLALECGFQACSVPVVQLDGLPVSSTRVRQAIRDGNLPLAEKLLGRRLSLRGTVVPGKGRGRTLGFPTVNLDLHNEIHPPQGVYATFALVDGKWLPSATNIGRAPSLDPPLQDAAVEAHIFDYHGELYGKDIELEFVAYLRAELKFQTSEALSAQIAADIVRIRQILSGVESRSELA